MKRILTELTTASPPVGVSIVIPCHNAAKRLPVTLDHLARQRVPDSIPWEVVVVDNASTDDTAQVALAAWPQSPPAPLRVVSESQLGAGPARSRGLTEAKYEFVSCLDDDNWVCTDWVALVAEIMRRHPEAGACGSFSDAVCEGTIPAWFDQFKTAYAIGAWGAEPGDVTDKHANLWSAGLTIRKSAWDQLLQKGFRPLLTGRKGRSKNLTPGEDSEICYALQLSGWRWWYEPRLQFQHYLPAARLTWQYLRRLHRGFGASSIVLDLYAGAIKGEFPSQSGRWIKNTWAREVYYATRRLVQFRFKLIGACLGTCEGDSDVLTIENQYGRWSTLLGMRKTYSPLTASIHNAPWRKDSLDSQTSS